MNQFQHIEPPLRVFHGENALQQLSMELDRLKCGRAVIMCGSTLARDGSPLSLVRDALGSRLAGVFAGVRAHSPLDSVREASRFLASEKADAVIAVGGGSAIVTARAASILLAEDDDIHRLCTRRTSEGRYVSPKLSAPKLVQMVIPSTPTTACVKAGSAVHDSETGQRLVFFDPKTRAHAVFVHPDLALSAPTQLIIAASMNGVSLACEGLESSMSEPISDALLMHALRLYRDALPQVKPQPTADVAGQLIMASLLAGKGTDYASGGIASALGHAIGVRSHVENGVINAILLPHTMRFNAANTRGGTARIGEALSGKRGLSSEDAIRTVAAFVGELGLPQRLRDGGVKKSDFDSIAAAAMEDWFVSRNPKPVHSAQELLEVLDAAW